jgi:hypothetical protein
MFHVKPQIPANYGARRALRAHRAGALAQVF